MACDTGLLDRFFASSPDLLAIIDFSGHFVRLNDAWERALGWSCDELMQAPFTTFIHADDLDTTLAEIDRWRETGEVPVCFVNRYRRKDGAYRWLEWNSTAFPDLRRMFCIARDISDRKLAEDHLDQFFALSADLLGIVRFDGSIVRVNQAWAELLGSPKEADVPDAIPISVHPDDRDATIAELVKLRHDIGSHSWVNRARCTDGAYRWLHWTATSLPDDRVAVFIGRDVSEQKREERDLFEYQTRFDDLSGLPNRTLLTERLRHELERRDRAGKPLCVMFADLDRFKAVNESLGHEAGDAVLVEVGARFSSVIGDADTLARFGGDEFGLLLPEVRDAGEARAIAGRLAATLREPIPIENRDVTITCSVGIVLQGSAWATAEQLLREASTATHQAKDQGGARVEFYSHGLGAETERRFDLEHSLRGAFRRDELAVHYQPIIEMQTGRIVATEALLRWLDPERGEVPALDFMRIAEDSGLVVEIGAWVLHTALEQARTWRTADGRHAPAMHVNLSARQLAQADICDVVAGALEDTDTEPAKLRLELTETALMYDTSIAADRLNALKDMGVSLAVDDFGTAYAGLVYLRRFPIDLIKIDRTFISGPNTNERDPVIVRALIPLAHTLGLQVVAEGIETSEQFELLRNLDCDLAQGFHLAVPSSGKEIGALLNR